MVFTIDFELLVSNVTLWQRETLKQEQIKISLLKNVLKRMESMYRVLDNYKEKTKFISPTYLKTISKVMGFLNDTFLIYLISHFFKPSKSETIKFSDNHALAILPRTAGLPKILTKLLLSISSDCQTHFESISTLVFE